MPAPVSSSAFKPIQKSTPTISPKNATYRLANTFRNAAANTLEKLNFLLGQDSNKLEKLETLSKKLTATHSANGKVYIHQKEGEIHFSKHRKSFIRRAFRSDDASQVQAQSELAGLNVHFRESFKKKKVNVVILNDRLESSAQSTQQDMIEKMTQIYNLHAQ